MLNITPLGGFAVNVAAILVESRTSPTVRCGARVVVLFAVPIKGHFPRDFDHTPIARKH